LDIYPLKSFSNFGGHSLDKAAPAKTKFEAQLNRFYQKKRLLSLQFRIEL